MKITILGSGSSLGVPVICCLCNVCNSNNPKNKRLRSCILIESEKTNILVDTSPDFRYQALKNDISSVDAVFFTHAHYDHIAGINDLKPFALSKEIMIPIYSDYTTIQSLEKHYKYIFDIQGKFNQPFLETNVIEYNKAFNVRDIKLEIFEQIHGNTKSNGLKINDKVAYSTDVSELENQSINTIKNIDTWIVGCITENKKNSNNFAHADLQQIIYWTEIIKPKQIILTHLGHTIDYQKLSKNLPKEMLLAYDGMTISC